MSDPNEKPLFVLSTGLQIFNTEDPVSPYRTNRGDGFTVAESREFSQLLTHGEEKAASSTEPVTFNSMEEWDAWDAQQEQHPPDPKTT